MTQIRLNTEQVRDTGRRLLTESTEIEEIGQALQHAMDGLDTWAWDGHSRADAEPLLDQMRPQSVQLVDELERLGRMLQRVADRFENEDSTAARELEGMPWVDLGPPKPKVDGITIIGEDRPEFPPDGGPIYTTLAVGEEGDFPFPGQIPITATTLAVGEESDFPPHIKPPSVTTLAVGEEDNTPNIPPDHFMSTMAVGEEGEHIPKYIQFPRVTTMAVGEEEAIPPYLTLPPVSTCAVGEEQDLPSHFESPRITTFAIGEEGDIPIEIEFPVVSTMAVGEEGEAMPVQLKAYFSGKGQSKT